MIDIYQVDAFTNRIFGGNPAAVCPLDEWLPDKLLQAIASENNLSETAFFVPKGDGFHLRWFTPVLEVALCGHATLASGHVILKHLGHGGPEIHFDSKSGALKVIDQGDRLCLDFPADAMAPVEVDRGTGAALALSPDEAILGDTGKLMLVLDSEDAVRSYRPDFPAIEALDARGLIITARGKEVDFVSRYFAPKAGIPEDPVTGSAHTMLAPFWAQKLGKNALSALQVSERLGVLECQVRSDRVLIAGQAVTFMKGQLQLESTAGKVA